MSMENHRGMVSTVENWFVHQSSLAILPAKSSSSKQEERGKKCWIYSFEEFLFIIPSYFLHAAKSYDMEPPAVLYRVITNDASD
jgi:hypothetical protein